LIKTKSGKNKKTRLSGIKAFLEERLKNQTLIKTLSKGDLPEGTSLEKLRLSSL
jgi:hypothetical protein